MDWWSLIWFNQAIPKKAFLLWLAVRNRLTTVDRLPTWGYKGDTQCCFCRHGTESRDHLFFNCSFSSQIWEICMKRRNFSNPLLDWQNVVEECSRKCISKKLKSVLCRLVLSSSVYNIWRARNEIKHNGRPKTEEQILRSIFPEVRTRISGKGNFKKNEENVNICLSWNIDLSIPV
ncbi:uncharacterized protein LOC133852713 [Alnus glutinosa]|uniref:uncharacterized protein LOC133852713 n=1 Tax=Alnus glutinosa TaxID=3517 RepID=UPI002D79FD26|nr:uncharacterized protein LOC133852713 [Alnus glutinosa]